MSSQMRLDPVPLLARSLSHQCPPANACCEPACVRCAYCALQLAKAYCREIFETLKSLKSARDMSVNEVKLIVSIEDPRAKERRAQGIEVRALRLCEASSTSSRFKAPAPLRTRPVGREAAAFHCSCSMHTAELCRLDAGLHGD